MPRKAAHSSYLQPDNRGRIQLPKELRAIPFFEVEMREGSLILHPLEVKRSERETAGAASRASSVAWLNKDVTAFIERALIPGLRDFLDRAEIPGLQAAVFYGSRTRGDALTSSDFDLALFCDRVPGLFARSKEADRIQEALATELRELRAHAVDGDLSMAWLPMATEAEAFPSLYYSIAADGLPAWQKSGAWDRWLREMRSHMSRSRVRAEGAGKRRSWRWTR